MQAARETGALKEAKDKLEKHVEELTWRLQLEKRLRVNSMSCSACNFHLAVPSPLMSLIDSNSVFHAYFIMLKYISILQTDLEEAKAQEITKLQNSLQEMHNKVEETNALIVKEREEAAKKAIEEATPVIKETQVVVEDTQKIDSLTAEVDSLKV